MKRAPRPANASTAFKTPKVSSVSFIEVEPSAKQSGENRQKWSGAQGRDSSLLETWRVFQQTVEHNNSSFFTGYLLIVLGLGIPA